MRIAVPRETQDNELRVGMTPDGARQLTRAGHEVIIETGAGVGSGIDDDAYRAAGARLAADAAETWSAGELIVKVKQPSEAECELFTEGSALFSFTHTETRPWLARAFLQRRMTVISFERVRLEDGRLPLLEPMSHIAGHMSVLIGAQLLQTVHGGPGVLVGAAPGAEPTRVVIIGGGTVGVAAAQAAVALGALVTLFELREQRRQQLRDLLPQVTVVPPTPRLVGEAVAQAWLVINGATVPAHSDQHVVSREMVRAMQPGAVIVDVTADLCGAIETTVRNTSHAQPTFVEEGVTHYVVPNIPGVVPRTSTRALEAASLPYTLRLAAQGIVAAIASDPALAGAVLCHDGRPVAPDMAGISSEQ